MVALIFTWFSMTLCYLLLAYLNHRAVFMRPVFIMFSMLAWLANIVVIPAEYMIINIAGFILLYVLMLVHLYLGFTGVRRNDIDHVTYQRLAMYFNFAFALNQTAILIYIVKLI